MVKADESSVDNLVGILHNFGLASRLENNWIKSIAYWCGCITPHGWVRKHQWKWVIFSDLSKLLGTPFGLQLDLKNIDQFMLGQVKNKLKYWNYAHLLLSGRTLIVNQILMSSF